MKISYIFLSILAFSTNSYSMLMIQKTGTRTGRSIKPSASHLRYKDNEQAIKNALQNAHRIPWEQTKNNLTCLIEDGVGTVDIPEYNGWGYTPLCHSLVRNDLEFTRYLLEHNANPNNTIKSVHSDKPIFFAKSVEAASLLQEYGAAIDVINGGQGVTSGMNLLHAAIGCDTSDDRLFDYFLEQRLDTHSLNKNGGNLWHSFVWISIWDFPRYKLFNRALKLHQLGINPYQQDKKGINAVDIVERHAERERQSAYKLALNFDLIGCKNAMETHDKLKTLCSIMRDYKQVNVKALE